MLALDSDSIAEVLFPSPKSLWLALIWPTLCLKIIFSWCKHVLFLFFCWFFFFSRLLYRFFTRIMTYFPMAGEREIQRAQRVVLESAREAGVKASHKNGSSFQLDYHLTSSIFFCWPIDARRGVIAGVLERRSNATSWSTKGASDQLNLQNDLSLYFFYIHIPSPASSSFLLSQFFFLLW